MIFQTYTDVMPYPLGTFPIIWEDVHEKWCRPLWNAFAKRIGIVV